MKAKKPKLDNFRGNKAKTTAQTSSLEAVKREKTKDTREAVVPVISSDEVKV